MSLALFLGNSPTSLYAHDVVDVMRAWKPRLVVYNLHPSQEPSLRRSQQDVLALIQADCDPEVYVKPILTGMPTTPQAWAEELAELVEELNPAKVHLSPISDWQWLPYVHHRGMGSYRAWLHQFQVAYRCFRPSDHLHIPPPSVLGKPYWTALGEVVSEYDYLDFYVAKRADATGVDREAPYSTQIFVVIQQPGIALGDYYVV